MSDNEEEPMSDVEEENIMSEDEEEEDPLQTQTEDMVEEEEEEEEEEDPLQSQTEEKANDEEEYSELMMSGTQGLDGVPEEGDDDDDDSYDDNDEDLNLQNEEEEYIDPRIDDEFKQQFIQQMHPEEMHESFEKINAMTKIKKIANTQIIQDENHTTYPFLTKYEKTRILGLRISQLNEGARPLVSLNHAILDNHIIAEQELREKKLPFIIMRPLPNGKKEYWKLQDLEIIER